MTDDEALYANKASIIADWWWRMEGKNWTCPHNLPTYSTMPDSARALYAFTSYLGDPIFQPNDGSRKWIVDIDKPAIRNLLDLLETSPHALTLLKIWKIKHASKD